MIYHHLFARAEKKITTAALIGTGHFGTAVLTQSLINPRLEIPVVCDTNIDAAYRTFDLAGIARETLAVCRDAGAARDALAAGKRVILQDAMLLADLPVDTVAEGTGNAEAGARHALAAINAGKHVVMVNKETDSCVGPRLFQLAQEKGVVYTPVDGDQHGALIQMLEWAGELGLRVVAAGKSRDAEFIYDRQAGTVTCYRDEVTIPETKSVSLRPEERAFMESLSPGSQGEGMAQRKKILARLDPAGGFDLCEMVIAANSSTLSPEVPSLRDYVLRISEIPQILCEPSSGGLLEHPGAIDVVTCLREPHEPGMGGGVFLVVYCDNGYSQHILASKGCLSSPDGRRSLVYRPFHLCGVEAATSLLCAGLLGIATGPARYRQRYDIVQTAARDLAAGEIMGNDHDARLKTIMVPMSPVADGGPIPAHMLSGLRLNRGVKAGTVITYGMVEAPAHSALWKLRAEQDASAV